MKRKALYFFLLILAAVLEPAVFQRVRLFGAGPDLFLIIIVLASVHLDLKWALAVAVSAGMLKDACGFLPFGVSTFAYPLVSYLIFRLNRMFSLQNEVFCACFTAASCLACAFVYRFYAGIIELAVPLGPFARISFLQALYTGLVFPVFVSGVRKVALR